MNDYYPEERRYEIAGLRWAALSLGLKLIADTLEHSSRGTVSEFEKPFDDACKSLVAKLNEPETCFACGQEKTA